MSTQMSRQYGDWRATSQDGREERIANGLGWFSIGLGLAEIAAPGKLANLIGLRDRTRRRTLMRIYGLREIAAGVGILSQQRPAAWMWGRVAGDLLDLTALGSAMTSSREDRARIGTATAAVLGVTALDVLCARQLSGASTSGPMSKDGVQRVTKTIIVGRSPAEVYGFWRDFNNLATFMRHVESVQMTGDNRSHWKVNAPGGNTVEWDAEIVDDQPNTRIAWRSLEGSDISHSGSVRFEPAPGGRGTLVRVELQYAAPAGIVGANIAKLFRAEPGQQVEDDLRAFKQVMETGEIARSDASIHRGMHPARPEAKAATA